MGIRGPARWLAAIGLATAFALAGATPVLAHATLLSSDPGNGSVLATAPHQVLLQFDVPVNPRLSSVALFDEEGDRVTGTRLEPAEGGSSLVVTLPPLQNGAYRLAFQARDDTDLHETGGAIVFGIGEAADLDAEPVTAARPSYAETSGRWLELGGISLLVGLVATLLCILPALAVRPACRSERERLEAIVVLAYVAILAGRAVQLVVAAAMLVPRGGGLGAFASATGSVLGDSRFGQLWLACVGVATLAALAARLAIAREGSRFAALALLTTTGTLVVVSAQSAHGAGHMGTDLTQTIARAVHLGAAGLWVGGLTVLVVLFAGAMRGGGAGAAQALNAFRRFTGLASAAVGLLFVSGLLLAGRAVVSPAALAETTYGLTLLAKLVAGAVALAFGIRHSLMLSPRPGTGAVWPGRLASSLPFEVGAMLVVLWGAAALGATPPATSAATAPQEPIIQADTTMRMDDLVVHASLDPAHPGANTLFVQVRGVASTATRPVTRMEVTLAQPGETPLHLTAMSTGRGRYEFPSVHVTELGRMDVGIDVTRGDGTEERASCTWVIAQPQAVPRSALPSSPWAPELDALATLLGLGLLGWQLVRLVRLRRAGSERAPATR